MAGETVVKSKVQRRRFARIPIAGTVHYICAPNDGGVGTWQDVGRGGACIRLDRNLRPGRHVLLSVKLGSKSDIYVELKGKVAWSRPTGSNGPFVAGLRFFHDAPEAGSALSELINDALAQVGEDDRTGAQFRWHRSILARVTRQGPRHAINPDGLRRSSRLTRKGLNLSPFSGIL